MFDGPQRPYGLLGTGSPGRPPRLSHTAPELGHVLFNDALPRPEMVQLSVALRPQRPYGLLGTGSPGRPPRLSHSLDTCCSMLLYVHRDRKDCSVGTGSLGRHLEFHTALDL